MSTIIAGIFFLNEYFVKTGENTTPPADRSKAKAVPARKPADFEKTKRNYTRLNLSRE